MSLASMNKNLFYAINGMHTPVLDQFMLLGSSLGDFNNLFWILLFGLLVLRIPQKTAANLPWLPRRDRLARFLATLLISCVVMAAVVMGLKEGLAMPRPFVALPAGTVHLLVQPHSLYSFPSGHSAFIMVLAVALWPWCRLPLYKGLLIFLVLWIGISRVSLGLHFPADVLAGYLCGGSIAWLVGKLPPFVFDRLSRGINR